MDNLELEAQKLPILTFRLGAQTYALGVDEVVEVAAMVELMAIPEARPEVLGVANRHGRPLPMLDLRQVFGEDATQINVMTVFVVGQFRGQQVGLVVDEIFQVEHVDAANLDEIPTTSKYIRGIISHQERLLQLIELPAIVAVFMPEDVDQSEVAKVVQAK